MKEMLILNASEDITSEEIKCIAGQAELYSIKCYLHNIASFKDLYECLFNGQTYNYIYLSTHGCETSFGNISGSVSVKWMTFAAMICASGVAKEGAVFFHSCCRGGLNQVAWEMFACCPKIEFVCGPRHDLYAEDLVTAFNLFLYNIEIRKIDPVRSAEKVLTATDVRLICYDRLETCTDLSYKGHCEIITKDIEKSFEEIVDYEEIIAAENEAKKAIDEQSLPQIVPQHLS